MLRGNVLGRQLPPSESLRPEEPVANDINSADGDLREVPREHSSSPSPANQHQSRGRTLSRSPPSDQQECSSTSSSQKILQEVHQQQHRQQGQAPLPVVREEDPWIHFRLHQAVGSAYQQAK